MRAAHDLHKIKDCTGNSAPRAGKSIAVSGSRIVDVTNDIHTRAFFRFYEIIHNLFDTLRDHCLVPITSNFLSFRKFTFFVDESKLKQLHFFK